MSETYGNKRKN